MSSDKSIVLAAYFYFYLKEETRALDFLELVQMPGIPSKTCEGWITLLHSEEPNLEKAFDIFEGLVGGGTSATNKPLETMMGYTQASYLKKKIPEALDEINDVIVSYPDFMPA